MVPEKKSSGSYVNMEKSPHCKCGTIEEKKEEERSPEKFSNVDEIEHCRQHNMIVPKSDTIAYLTGKTSSTASSDDIDNKIRALYEKLFRIARVNVIVRVVATTSNLEVVLDFQREKYGTVLGLTMPQEGRICIAAKRGDNELLGIMAYTFCNIALHIVYENGGKPYRQGQEDRRDQYRCILDEITQTTRDLPDIIQEVLQLCRDPEEDQLVACIARILAVHFEERDTDELQGTPAEALSLEQYPQLYQFFKDNVIPDMEQYIRKNGLEKDELVQMNSSERAPTA